MHRAVLKRTTTADHEPRMLRSYAFITIPERVTPAQRSSCVARGPKKEDIAEAVKFTVHQMCEAPLYSGY